MLLFHFNYYGTKATEKPTRIIATRNQQHRRYIRVREKVGVSCQWFERKDRQKLKIEGVKSKYTIESIEWLFLYMNNNFLYWIKN